MYKKIKDVAWLLLGLFIFGDFTYKVAMNSFTDHFMGDSPQITKAVIINEKNYIGNHVDPIFNYSYQFMVNGEKYTGNSHDTTLIVGDSVEVKYNKDHPGINRPLNPKD